jgi:PPOX class probable F420-dependent enzyme
LLICSARARCGTLAIYPARDKEQPMATIPDAYLDLVQQKKAFANLATTMPDGTPQVTPVWFDYNNGVIRVNSAKGRTKTRNMQQGAPVALSIMDPDNAYRYVQVRGKVTRVTEEGAGAHIDSLAKKYIDQDKYPWSRPGDVRVTFEITPTAIQTMG